MTAFPIECYRPQIAEIAQTVYQTMVGVSVEPVDSSEQASPGALTAAVYYAGSWKGALLVECSAEQAKSWSARLMSIPPPISLDDARDGLGELTNMMAGNLKALLPPGVGLSIPSVVQGSDYSLRICGGNLFETLHLADGEGVFRITLVEVIE